MATVVQSIIEPDESVIKAHLEMLFTPVRDEYPRGLIELRFGEHFQSSYFNLREDGIADAARYAANRNREGGNVYVGVNPRRPETDRKSGAFDSDIEVAIWQFADLDDEESVAKVGKRLKALPPFFSVTTGTEPFRRPHFYWLLDEPVRNLSAWRDRQRGIVQSLESDKSIINPSRIMRLAGTVNFPQPHKLQKGYRVELTSWKTQFSDERSAVTPEEVGMAYPLREEAARDYEAPVGNGSTLSAMAPQSKTRALIDAALSGDHWHDNVRDLAARLARLGRSDAEIMLMADALTLPGYTVEQTRSELRKFIEGARTKYGIPHPVDDDAAAPHEPADSVFELLDLDAIELIPPPTYLIENVLPDDGLAIMYGDPGAGKSFIALDAGLRLSNGMDWHGIEAKPTGVLYIAGEAQKGVANRIKGWRRHHGLQDVHAPFILLPVAVQLLDPDHRAKLIRSIDAAIAMAGFHIGLVIVDTVSRSLAGADENGQESMSAFVSACDEIKRHVGGALLGVHHTGKDKEKGMRGSSVLLGACDASFKVTKSEYGTVTIDNEKQKDAEEAQDIHLKLVEFSWAHGLDKETKTLVPLRSEEPQRDEQSISTEQIARAFGIIADAWSAGRPLSASPNTRSQGRYAVSVIANKLGVSEGVIRPLLVSWIEHARLSIEEVDSHSKAKGLMVIDPIGGRN